MFAWSVGRCRSVVVVRASSFGCRVACGPLNLLMNFKSAKATGCTAQTRVTPGTTITNTAPPPNPDRDAATEIYTQKTPVHSRRVCVSAVARAHARLELSSHRMPNTQTGLDYTTGLLNRCAAGPVSFALRFRKQNSTSLETLDPMLVKIE